MRSPASSLVAIAIFECLLADGRAAPAADDVFVDLFRGQSPAWKVETKGAEQPGLVREVGGKRPGMYFVTEGLAVASAPWEIGAEPFEFSFEIDLDYGSNRAWRWPGVLVGLTSAAPDAMDDDDVAIFAGAIAQGIHVGIRTGKFYEGYEERPGLWRWTGKNVSERFVLNMGGAGGHDYSIQWPSKRVDGLTLRMVITRAAEDLIRFTVYHPCRVDRPWWTGEAQLPERLRDVAITHIVVRTLVSPEVYGNPTQRIREGDEYRGRIYNIQGRPLGGPHQPQITGIEAPAGPLTEGSKVTVLGAGFALGTRAEIGGQPASQTRILSENALEVTLAHLAPNQFHALTVIGPSGLAATHERAIPAGRFVDRIEPREASPAGGDVVTVIGGGFDEQTRITIGGVQAEIVRRVGPAAVQIHVPAAKQPGMAAIAVTSGGASFAGEPAFGYAPHPYLWFDEPGLATLRKKFQAPAFADYRALLLREGDKPLGEIGKFGQPNFSDAIHAYLWTYLLTGEKEYSEKLRTCIDELFHGSDRLPAEVSGYPGHLMQHVKLDEFWCHNAEAVATVYDALFGELTPQERTEFLKYLDRAQEYYLDRVTHGDWWYTNNPSNTIAVGNGCGGIVALTLRNSTPNSARAVDLAVKMIREKYQGIAEDGSCVEGSLYWDYGFTYQLLFGRALENATGDARGLLMQPRYEQTPRFVQTQFGGAGRLLVFNDTQPWLTGMGVAAHFGRTLDNDLLRWLADAAAHAAANDTVYVFRRPQFDAFAFRERDTKEVNQFPGAPNVAHLPLLNWGVLRSDGKQIQPGLVVGVKGRDGAVTHHAQEDLGSFTLDARGESLLLDPGYYQGEATKHSLPLIDGQGPDRRGKGLITDSADVGPWRMMAIDATDAYEESAKRMRRVFVMHGDEAVIVLDDIVPCGKGEVTYQLQCAAPATVADGDAQDAANATVTGKKVLLSVRVAGCPITLTAEGPLDFGRSWVYAEEDWPWHKLSGQYTARTDRPLVTVLIPGAAGAPPKVEIRHGDKDVRVTLPSGATAEFTQEVDGWAWTRPEANP